MKTQARDRVISESSAAIRSRIGCASSAPPILTCARTRCLWIVLNDDCCEPHGALGTQANLGLLKQASPKSSPPVARRDHEAIDGPSPAVPRCDHRADELIGVLGDDHCVTVMAQQADTLSKVSVLVGSAPDEAQRASTRTDSLAKHGRMVIDMRTRVWLDAGPRPEPMPGQRSSSRPVGHQRGQLAVEVGVWVKQVGCAEAARVDRGHVGRAQLSGQSRCSSTASASPRAHAADPADCCG